jgi:hypothetical protein
MTLKIRGGRRGRRRGERRGRRFWIGELGSLGVPEFAEVAMKDVSDWIALRRWKIET